MKGPTGRRDSAEGAEDREEAQPGAAAVSEHPEPAPLARTPADLMSRSPAGRASAVAALSAGAGNHAVTQWLARSPDGAGTATAPAAETLDDDELEDYDDEIEFHYDASDYDVADGMLTVADSDDEAAFWLEVMEDPTLRALHFRWARILEEKYPTTHAQLDEMYEKAEEWAGDEAKTLQIIGTDALTEHAWAFPRTWADKVAAMLKPPSDLDLATAQAAEKTETAALGEIAERFPADVYARGLPVPFAEALQMTSYGFKPSQSKLAKNHVVKDFAVQARKAIAAKVRADIARQWKSGKDALVGAIRSGAKSIDPASFEKVADQQGFDHTLSELASTAVAENVEIFKELALTEAIDLWRHELALAKLAGTVSLLRSLDATKLVEDVFNNALAAADEKVAAASGRERMNRADIWGDEWGYPAAARKAMMDALKKNAGDIVMDVVVDVGLGAIPIFGWFWKAKDLVEEVYEVYESADKMMDVRSRIEDAKTVVGLQRASAELSAAEYNLAMTTAVFAAKQGGEKVGEKGVDALKKKMFDPKTADPKAGG